MSALIPLLVGLTIGAGPTPAAPAAAESNSCVSCHQTAETTKAFPSWAQDQFLHWYGAVHGEANVTCERCHGGDPKQPKREAAHKGVLRSNDVKSLVYYKNLPNTCGACHQAVKTEFATSKHYERLTSERLAPTCTTCHGFQMAITAVNPMQLAGRCALCHNAEGSGVKPEVAARARVILEGIVEARRQLEAAQHMIVALRARGKDVARAQKQVDEAATQLGRLAVHFHRFDFPALDVELERVRVSTKGAWNTAVEALPAKPQ